ncbi:amidohydrolase family protein [Acetobacteraceae bacterium H6797]|nr:amidohydrolase family protein [Acetobacteraceae bacterium H6797]
MLIDAHFHVFDPAFPLPGNDGYAPPDFTVADYLAAARPLGVTGGVLVAASTHGLDPAPLLAALRELGPGFVAVLNADERFTDEDLRGFAAQGVRGLRYNLYRGTSAPGEDLLGMARRARDAAGLHAQIYADLSALPDAQGWASLGEGLVVDHLGMTEAGLPLLLELAAGGAKVKATGFGRVALDVPRALERIAARAPKALMFGTDMPSTRAKRPFEAGDIDLLRKVLGEDLAKAALHDTAAAYYGLTPGA